MRVFKLGWRHRAGVAQLVEHQLPKLRVVSSSLIARSYESPGDEAFRSKRASVDDTRRAASRITPWCTRPDLRGAASRVVASGVTPRQSGLRNDEICRVVLDDDLYGGVLVPGHDEESRPIGTHMLVLSAGERDPFDAATAGAFADEVWISPASFALGNLVRGPKERLVLREAHLACLIYSPERTEQDEGRSESEPRRSAWARCSDDGRAERAPRFRCSARRQALSRAGRGA